MDLHPKPPLADIIRGARLRRGWTQVEMARRCGVSQPNVAQWESGNPGPDTLAKVAAAMGITVDELLTEGVLTRQAARARGGA